MNLSKHRGMLLILRLTFYFLLTWTGCSYPVYAATDKINSGPAEQEEALPKIDVKPKARDQEIQKRIDNILTATNWYERLAVKVDDGIVCLKGEAKTEEHKKWAQQLAQKIQDVVAVVNKIKVTGPASWYIQQILADIQELWQRILHGLPFFVFAILILLLSWGMGNIAVVSAKKTMRGRNIHPLLTDVIAKAIIVLCFLLGLYFVLQILGLTTMAMTVIGGTGILGIILGIAFKNITENLLASILLSVQKPFQTEDLIEIDGILGYVQGLTMRATILMTLEGHEVQIPNASVYRSNISNFTSNPNRREEFVVGIGYEDAISHAQAVALDVLRKHPAVLDDPEPWVLVEELASATVNLHVFFWLDGSEYQWRKVRSSVIRLIKRAFQNADISMPGQVIELSAPEALPFQLLDKKTSKIAEKTDSGESSSIATQAEGQLKSEFSDIKEQARQSRVGNQEQNLLR